MTSKQGIKQNIIIAVLGVATLFFAFLSVLAFVPANTEVEIREEITVSAALVDATAGEYLISVNGTLRNTTGADITLQSLNIPVDGKNQAIDGKVLRLEHVTVPARSSIPVQITDISLEKCDTLGEITAVYGGEEVFLRNPAEIAPTAVLVPLAGTAILAFFLVRACKIRYYIRQEERADRS